MPALTPKQRLKLLEEVYKKGKSVASACRKFNVSRFTYYKWAKRYDPKLSRNKNKNNLTDKKPKIKRYAKQVPKEISLEVKKLASIEPEWSKYKFAKEIKKKLGKDAPGIHGIYNVLRRSGLNTIEARRKWREFVLKTRKRTLSPELRLEVINRAEKLGVSVTEVCSDFGISRQTFYKWKRIWEKKGKTIDALRDRKTQYDRRHLRVKPALEKEILSIVVEFPNLSKYDIERKLAEKFGKVLSPHGVYNVLLRNGLNRPEDRYIYSTIRAPEIVEPETWTDRVRYVLEQFIPSLAPAPPPRLAIALASAARPLFNFLKTFSIASILSSATIYSFLWWINLVAQQLASVSIGLVFATIALFMGSLFFLYSLKYYLTLAIVLSFSQSETGEGQEVKGKRGILSWLLGVNGRNDNGKSGALGLTPNLEHVILKRYPFVSIHIPLYNEKNVVERIMTSVSNFDYSGDYEVILADDSTDETTQIIREYMSKVNGKRLKVKENKKEGWTLTKVEVRPGVVFKHLHRTSRSGFKGGALRLALRVVDPRTEFISVFDADFVPYPDTLELFLKYFQATTGSQDLRFTIQESGINHKSSIINPKSSRIAAVQGYQWHVLNKSENWITRGVRSEYAGSYVIERSGTEIYSGLKQISGAVYMVRRDVLEEVGWEESITEDFQLTLKLYEKGYKVVYTPYIQAPAECVSTLKRLIRQRMRWAEGHSHNVRKMFTKLIFGKWIDTNVGNDQLQITNDKLKSNVKGLPAGKVGQMSKVFVPSPLTLSEKLEFLYLSPYYLQAFFFLLGTLSWLISETLFPARLPFWTSLWGWSLVLTNLLSLPLMNAVGLFLEESEERDYQGLVSFIALTYILVPFQAYAALKGFLSKEEGPWFRTPKTGKITDIFTRGRFYRFISGILPGKALGTRQLGNSITSSAQSLVPNAYLSLATANSRFYNSQIRPRKIRWVSKATLASLLIITLFLNYLSFFTPTAYAQAADPSIEQQINIIDQEYSTTSTTDVPDDNSLGLIRWDGTKYTGDTVFFEAVLKMAGLTPNATATLYTSTGSAVSGSAVSTASDDYLRVRSSSIALSDGTDYTVRIRTDSGGGFAASIKAARLIIVQTNGTMITNTAHHIEIGNKDEMFGARVQRGTQSISAGTTSSTATVTSVDTNRSFLICAPGENTSTGPDDLTYTCELTNSTTITFTRPSGNSGTLTIRWQLIEYDNLRVQASQVSMASGTGSTSYTIPTAVDRAKTFMTLTVSSDSTSTLENVDRYVSANITSSTNVDFTRAQTTGAVDIEFFIIEFLDETYVEQWSVTIADAADSNTVTLTGPSGSGVDTSRSFVLGYSQSTSTANGMNDVIVSIELTNATTVTVDRGGGTPLGANTIIGWVIELSKEGSGDNGAMVEAISQGDITVSPTTITLTNSFDENRSFIWGSATESGGGTAWDRAEFGFQLTAVNQIQITTGDVANTDTFLGSAVQLPDWRIVTEPKIYTFDSTKFSGTLTANFEGTLRSNEATASAQLRLYNITDNETVTSSTVTVSGTTWDRQVSSALTIGASAGNLKSGKEYVVQLNYVSGVEAQIANAKLVLTQSDAGGLTSMEIIHTYVNTLATDTDSTYTTQDFDNLFDDDNFVGGTFAYRNECTLKTSAGTGYCDIFDGTSQITNSEVTTDGTDDNDYDRIRSSSDLSGMPTAATNLDTRIRNSAASGNTTSVSNSWLVITVTNLQIPENLLLFIPLILFLPALIKRFKLKGIGFATLFLPAATVGRKNRSGRVRNVINIGGKIFDG